MMIALYIFTAMAAALGAVLSKNMKAGGSMVPYFLTSAWMGPLSWALLAKNSPKNLLVTSVLWNVVYEGTWTIITIWLSAGEVKPMQALGAAFVLVGLLLL